MSYDGRYEEIEVLIAEDDSDDRFLFQEAFKAVGFVGKVHFFEDGQSLMDFLLSCDSLKTVQMSCLLLDMNMPRMDGRQALKSIRQNQNLHKLKTFVISTSDSPGDIEQCYQFDIIKYYVKPYNFEELIEIVKQIIAFCFPANSKTRTAPPPMLYKPITGSKTDDLRLSLLT